MCPPTYFDVQYRINPWMRPEEGADLELAKRQWVDLRKTLEGLGHTVDVIDPVPGLPDMVFAANGGLAIGNQALAPRFRNVERQGETAPFAAALKAVGYDDVKIPSCINEGEGDFLFTGRVILGGSGFRSDPAAGAEVQDVFGLPVVTLVLVDPRFYHLDTAMTLLAPDMVAFWPGAFSPSSQAVLRHLFPGAIEVDESDAAVLGLNAISDGRHVVLPAETTGYISQLRERGFIPVPVQLSELRKAGGGPKCCVLERR